MHLAGVPGLDPGFVPAAGTAGIGKHPQWTQAAKFCEHARKCGHTAYMARNGGALPSAVASAKPAVVEKVEASLCDFCPTMRPLSCPAAADR